MSDDSSANDALGTLRAAIKQAVTDVHEQTPLAQSFTNFVTIQSRCQRTACGGRHRGHELSAG